MRPPGQHGRPEARASRTRTAHRKRVNRRPGRDAEAFAGSPMPSRGNMRSVPAAGSNTGTGGTRWMRRTSIPRSTGPRLVDTWTGTWSTAVALPASRRRGWSRGPPVGRPPARSSRGWEGRPHRPRRRGTRHRPPGPPSPLQVPPSRCPPPGPGARTKRIGSSRPPPTPTTSTGTVLRSRRRATIRTSTNPQATAPVRDNRPIRAGAPFGGSPVRGVERAPRPPTHNPVILTPARPAGQHPGLGAERGGATVA